VYFEKASFGGAEDVLKKKPQVVTDIEQVLHDLNTAISWHGQTRMNRDLDALFGKVAGWTRQVDSLLKLESERGNAGPKSIDFRNIDEKVDVETEFGNVASVYRDIFKFNIAKNANQIEVGVIIAGNREIARTVGENVTSFERCKDELSISWKYRANADCPVMLYGLLPLSYPSKKSIIDPKAKQAREQVMKRRKERGQERSPEKRRQETLR
jgi:hypothetical protein